MSPLMPSGDATAPVVVVIDSLPPLGLHWGLILSFWAGLATALGGGLVVYIMGSPSMASHTAQTGNGTSGTLVEDVQGSSNLGGGGFSPPPPSLLQGKVQSGLGTHGYGHEKHQPLSNLPMDSSLNSPLAPPQRHKTVLAFSLGMAAGVMLTVSLFDMIGPTVMREGVIWPGFAVMLGVFLFGSLSKALERMELAGGVDTSNLLPLFEGEFALEMRSPNVVHAKRNWRLAVVMFVALTAHNLPEGVAVCVSSAVNEKLGLRVAWAVAWHNMPEGAAISAPLYAATGSRFKAIMAALISGLSEFVGALLATWLGGPMLVREPWLIQYVLCVVAGIMISASFLELIPAARAYRMPGLVRAGAFVGFLIMMMTMWVV